MRDKAEVSPLTGRIALYARVSSLGQLEMIFQSETGDELVDDFVIVITSMAARLYGRRQSKRRAEKIKQCVEQVMKEFDTQRRA